MRSSTLRWPISPVVPPIAAGAIVLIVIIIVVMAAVAAQSPDDFPRLLPAALVIGLVATALAVRQFYVASRLRELKSIIETEEAKNVSPKISKEKLDEMLRASREKRAIENALQDAVKEQQRIADILSRFKCFYAKDGETLGPVTVWQIHEMIEMDQLTPDVLLMMEGSDYWRSYARIELALLPPNDSAQLSKLLRAADLQCYYSDGEKPVGPFSLLAIFHYIRSGKLAADVGICAEGSSEWKRACDI
jgi:hypothetical protein